MSLLVVTVDSNRHWLNQIGILEDTKYTLYITSKNMPFN